MIYSLIQYLFYTHHACYLPYISLFLMGRQVDTIHIGFILSINSAVMVFSQPFWGVVSDRVGSVRKVFMFCLAVSLTLIFAITFVYDVWILTLLFPVITFFVGPLMPLMDNWMSRNLKNREDISFGRTRLWGSIGFAIMVALLGRIVRGEGDMSLPFRLFSLLSLFTLALLTRVPDAVPEHSSENRSFLHHVGELLVNGKYLFFILSAFLVFFSIMPSIGFLPKFIEHVGGDSGIYGLAMAISALAEVPVFYFGSRLLKRVQAPHLLLASFFMFSLRLVLNSLFPSVPTVLLSQILQGFAYSLFVSSSLYYVDSLADGSCKATAFLLGNATYAGMSGIAGNFTGGLMIQRMGVQNMFRIGAGVSLVAVGIFALSLIKGKGNKKSYR